MIEHFAGRGSMDIEGFGVQRIQLFLYLGLIRDVADIFTIAANLSGACGISVPCGFSDGLPVGFQLMGPPLAEPTLLRAARAVEAAAE